MHRNRSVDVQHFAMIPRAEIPRSSFRMQKSLKTTFDAGYLVPIMVEEVLPGDTFRCRMTAFCRLATPIFPVMDNLHLETFFFFVPNRLVWANWVKFMGEQDNPGDSISYVVPTIPSPVGGFQQLSIYDMMGVPCSGQIDAGEAYSINALPLRCYNRIYNEWFRDENLQNSVPQSVADGTDSSSAYTLLRRGKRHDYFTGCLPWTQKGGTAVQLPLGTSAPVKGLGWSGPNLISAPGTNVTVREAGADTVYPFAFTPADWSNQMRIAVTTGSQTTARPAVYADLSQATAATINQLRTSFQVQKLLERDARGGTRYTEIVRSHFGVISPDARLQRPEYLGGGHSPITINPVAQTSGSGASGQSTPQGNLAAIGTALAREHGFTQSFTEHGYIIGLANVRADLTYQQGLRRMWSRSTRYDFYFPVFAALGEQPVYNREIFCDGTANDALVFGYQERWAEYRYNPSQICGLFRSTSTGTIDAWHLAQNFDSLPTLNSTFIQDTPPVERILAVGDEANGQQILMDAFFDISAARPMPVYSVPGLIDHF